MEMRILPEKLKGRVVPPPSKSETHRYLIGAFLSENETIIENPLICDDTLATVEALRKLGGNISFTDDGKSIKVLGRTNREEYVEIDCNESASTARFILPLACFLNIKTIVTGKNSLIKRPVSSICRCLREHGTEISGEYLPVTVFGRPEPGIFSIPGNISSQFVSGLMFILPLLSGDSEIRLTTEIQSEDYVNLTMDVLEKFGIRIIKTDEGYLIPGNQKYISPGKIKIGMDCSAAGFWLAAGKMGSEVETAEYAGLNDEEKAPDHEVKSILDRIFTCEDSSDREESNGKNITVNVKNCIDCVPVLAVAVCATGKTVDFTGTERLKIKECDRLTATVNMIRNLGGDAESDNPDRLTVRGRGKLRGGYVDISGDHRIAMAAVIASSVCEEEIAIEDWEKVSKSYPDFFEDFEKLGGKKYVIDLR